ncbi:hypothetical protein KIN20_019625 [Parelaphostrongylus tenuis]|uniref:Uncharacterized protein n=1 Tax=Parelaphostrongylus tenuis TaxID=148309 RepID=A0AAD5MRU1_PARTN|nr:hypothetical protein KIN20_019624 [Parelaphostrongylus tenuis]KAJ1360604.1 hypothetical protein KIN20_019625 [Parelaphostrongylus tenuis]
MANPTSQRQAIATPSMRQQVQGGIDYSAFLKRHLKMSNVLNDRHVCTYIHRRPSGGGISFSLHMDHGITVSDVAMIETNCNHTQQPQGTGQMGNPCFNRGVIQDLAWLRELWNRMHYFCIELQLVLKNTNRMEEAHMI